MSPGRSPYDLNPRQLMAQSDGSVLTEPSVDHLIPLFAPYCGGLAYQTSLEDAVALLLRGHWSGERPLEGGRVHALELHWSGEPAPLEPLHCHLRFPALPSVTYDFDLPAYELVQWLMLRQDRVLPEAFWRWLLIGIPLNAGHQDLSLPS